MAQLKEITDWLDTTLDVKNIKDSSANGLQVDGAQEVNSVGLAVDACLAAYEAAAEESCQMVIAHHGIIWDHVNRITGPLYRQIRFLVEKQISLYGAHLPLDLHPELGNNAELARILGIEEKREFGSYHGITIGCKGTLPRPMTLPEITKRLTGELGGPVVELEFGPDKISTVGIISGGAAAELQEAIDDGLDCYITGEPAHWNYHQAKEAGINVLYAGHYFSEKCGVIAVGRALEQEFGVTSTFLDLPTTI